MTAWPMQKMSVGKGSMHVLFSRRLKYSESLAQATKTTIMYAVYMPTLLDSALREMPEFPTSFKTTGLKTISQGFAKLSHNVRFIYWP